MGLLSFANTCVVRKATQTASCSALSDVVVVLVGWANAKDSHLVKYSQLYEQKGLTTVRYTTSLPIFAFRKLWVSPGFSSPLLAELDRLEVAKPRRVLLHLFSMNSLFVLNSMLNAKPDFMDGVQGVVFDSCPSVVDLGPYKRVLDIALPQRFPNLSPITLVMLKYLIMGTAVLTECKDLALDALVGKLENRRIYNWMMESVDLPKLQLYFYSKADSFCRYAPITDFYEDQVSRRKALATQVLLEDSPHVEHFLRYPELYKSSIYNFLDKFPRYEGECEQSAPRASKFGVNL